ncbi:MAG: hypothetical protein R3F43_23460 [bacterium]
MGVTRDIPEGCDLLAGICLMAGPVNQNDIGKTYYGMPDLLAETWPTRQPTSLLVWTLKAKTVADPVGNEEQLLNEKRKGALVDLRPGPHDVIQIERAASAGPCGRRARPPTGRAGPTAIRAAWPPISTASHPRQRRPPLARERTARLVGGADGRLDGRPTVDPTPTRQEIAR